MYSFIKPHKKHIPWNKGKLIGQKPPLKLKQIWSIKVRLQISNNLRELALFNLAIDSKLRSCDLVQLKVLDVSHGLRISSRANILQKKTHTPLRNQTFFTSKSGNVDEASSYGGKINLSKRLDFIGVPNAVITANYVYEKRRARDQFTDLSRIFPWTSDHTLNVNFRHDITSIRVAYGFSGQFKSQQISQDINYFWPTTPAATFEAFAEYNPHGVKIALRAENLTGKRSKSTFTFYNDHIRFNDVLSRTERETTNWTEITLSIQGTF